MVEQLQISTRSGPHYTACYCEENTVLALRHLTEHAAADACEEFYAVFVSNPLKQVNPSASGTPHLLFRAAIRQSLRW